MTASKISYEKFCELSIEELLKLRFRQLPISLEKSELAPLIQKFYLELEWKGLFLKPQLFLGDEWFSPEGMNAISVPFYLVDPILVNLEKSKMFEVEGGTQDQFMKLLRHEAGHCFDHCFKFSKRKKWRKIFGSPDQDYKPETYRPQPYSKSYVIHLDRWYAQAHPDEDFAETFAVWLDPQSQWQEKYKDWPVVYKKLNYIEELVKESSKLKDLSEKGRLPSQVSQLSMSLENYYSKKIRENADHYPDFYDADLRKIFNGSNDLKTKEFSAAKFMRRHKKEIIETVAWSTSEKKIIIHSLIKRLILRCQELNLKQDKSDLITIMVVSSFLTSLIKNYLFTGQFKRTA